MEVTRTFDLLERYRQEFPEKADALAAKEKGEWVRYSTQDYLEQANAVSRGLLEEGIGKGDRIVTITPNRPEWNFLDMGMAQIGAVHVPLFPTLQDQEYEDLIQHAGPSLVIVGTKAILEKVRPALSEKERAEKLLSLDELDGASHWTRIRNAGLRAQERQEEVERIKSSIEPSEWTTLIYTSGTTGDSKGVMLSHRNMMSNAKAASEVFGLKADERYLCILPLCHVGERMANYQTQYSGCSIYYNQSIGTIVPDMKEVKPHGFGAVPRILERVYEKIVSQGEKLKGVQRKLFFRALELGKRYDPTEKKGLKYRLELKWADKLIFSKWREAMGGNVKAIGVGGAALPSELERVFWAADIKLLNMYGLTETSPIVTINRTMPPDLKLGTVGTAIPDVEVRIADDGEVICRGPNVMMGYYRNQEATDASFDENGWFYTGDVGVLEEARFLRITDRKKSIFKLSNGKYVAPQHIENRFASSLFVDRIMVTGEGEKYASALIVPNFEQLKEWARNNGLEEEGKEDLIENDQVKRLFREIVDRTNEEFEKDLRIRAFRLVPDEWSPENGELSPTLKLKRKVILYRYASLIKDMYRS